MTFFEFDDSLKVGNRLIDQEHATLIDYINLLQQAMENETSDKVINKILLGLVEYTKTHFFVEEELMQAYQYPSYESHLKAHESFKAEVDSLIERCEKGDDAVSDSVLGYLKQWLTEHILKVDRKLSDFLRDKSMD